MKKITLLSIILLLVFVSCRKDFEENTSIENPHTPVVIENYQPALVEVNASVFGVVVNEAGVPIEDAIISLGSETQTTGEYGTFSFKNTLMNQKGTFVKVEKAGYFLSGRRFYPADGSRNEIKIELLQKTFTESFESTNGGTINILGDGGTIVFQPNSIKNENGGAYNGTVKVATKYLDPAVESTFDQMPGALQGVNTSNDEVGLATYGMVGVELEGSAGEKLNIADGSSAQLNITLPASLQSTAPSEIPLWSFNYTYGIWVEEGSASLQNGKYVGDVSHFSFWNCDYPFETVAFDMTVVDVDDQNPIQGLKVKISLVSNGAVGFGYSNLAGEVSGIIPANEELLLQIYSPCGDLLLTQNIGPFTVDVSLGEFEAGSSFEISGTLLDCNGDLVSNGLVLVYQGNQFIPIEVDANPFTIRNVNCSGITSIDLAGGDLDSYQQGNPVTFPIDGNDFDAGDLVACGQAILGYMKITVEGTSRLFKINQTSQLPDTIAPHVQYLRMFGQPNVPAGDTLFAQVGTSSPNNGPLIGVGDWSAGNFIDIIGDSVNEWWFTDSFETFIIDTYGQYTGTEMSGHMSGLMINKYQNQNTQVWVEAEFRVIRYQD